jgi:long-chain acyl-CoA synthetase
MEWMQAVEIIAKIYPEDALASQPGEDSERASELDAINSSYASTLDELFRERVRRSADKIAYTQYDSKQRHWYGVSWAGVASEVERWQVSFRAQGLEKGDRVAICHRNSIEWVIFDQAALRLGLVVVPLYTQDRPENTAYVIDDSGAKLVLFNSMQRWLEVANTQIELSSVEGVLVLQDVSGGISKAHSSAQDEMRQTVVEVSKWLPENGQYLERGVTSGEDLASIVYTSGATGRPKGVMLSHKNLLSNAYSGMRSVALRPVDRLLSFLPLSHTLQRTVGYYAAMLCSASVTFNRSIPELSPDLLKVKPTVLISVPRIFERVHNQIYNGLSELSSFKQHLFKRAIKTGWHRFQYQQGIKSWHPRLLLSNILDRLVASAVRDRLGGNLHFVIVGGAPRSIEVTKAFIGLGVPLLHGYGLTECSPVVSVNTIFNNRPDSIGLPLRGLTVRLMENDEIWVKGDNVMMGYWGQGRATAKTLTTIVGETWLKTRDRGEIDEQGFLRIIGRIKDSLVLANGEKVSPSEIEAAVLRDTLFEQVMVVGEARPYLTTIVVLSESQWPIFAEKTSFNTEELSNKGVHKAVLDRIEIQMRHLPGYTRIRHVYLSIKEWTVESGLLTPTLKMKRPELLQHFNNEIEQLYAAHGVHKDALTNFK